MCRSTQLLVRRFPSLILPNAAGPTSPASYQTKGGRSVGRTENTKVPCRERKIRSDEDTALIQIESEGFAWKIREWMGKPREMSVLSTTKDKTKGSSRQRDTAAFHIHTGKFTLTRYAWNFLSSLSFHFPLKSHHSN